MKSPTFLSFLFLHIADVNTEQTTEPPNISAQSHTARLGKQITRSHLGRKTEGQFWVQGDNLLNKRHGPNKMEDPPRLGRNK
uniref:Putative secreted protein n=1 Tax=Ixodes ricinus TaxID=34613 RepID=A0A6B0U792_IXORI